MNARQTQNGGEIDDIELITREEFQKQQADHIEKEIFNDAGNAQKTAGLIQQFVHSYEQHKNQVPLEQWLTEEFRKYPRIWSDSFELENAAKEIIVSVQRANRAKESLYQHLDQGKSKESWLAKRIEEGATAAGVSAVGLYAERMDQELMAANVKSYDAIFNKKPDLLGDWEVSNSQYMHGFIAEVDVANHFNINASASHSGVIAEVLGSTSLNSADLAIRDAAGNVLQNVQVKSYADIEQAITNIRSHGYQDQTTLLVHEEQVERLQREFPNLKVTSRLEADGVSADMRSYAEYKQRQYDAQMREETRMYEWNDINRINITKGIGKQALIGAGIVAAFQGVRILGRRIWNSVAGKDNLPVSEDLKEFFTSSIKAAKHVGVQVAVSGAVVVAVKNGWMGKVLRGTPVGQIANAVYIGMENVKILYKLAKGEVTAAEALDAMGNVTTSILGGLVGAGIGMAKGAAFGALLGPVGAVLGGFVGSIVGGMAGSTIAEAVYAGGKVIVKTAAKVVKAVWGGVKDTVKAIGRVLNPLSWFA